MAHGVWVQRWEESERGWGTRPDGCWLYLTVEAAEEDTKRQLREMRTQEAVGRPRGYVPDEYSRPCGNPHFSQVSDEIYAEVESKGRMYHERWL